MAVKQAFPLIDRRADDAAWAGIIPADGMACYSRESNTLKIGDGTTLWSNLPSVSSEHPIVTSWGSPTSDSNVPSEKLVADSLAELVDAFEELEENAVLVGGNETTDSLVIGTTEAQDVEFIVGSTNKATLNEDGFIISGSRANNHYALNVDGNSKFHAETGSNSYDVEFNGQNMARFTANGVYGGWVAVDINNDAAGAGGGFRFMHKGNILTQIMVGSPDYPFSEGLTFDVTNGDALTFALRKPDGWLKITSDPTVGSPYFLAFDKTNARFIIGDGGVDSIGIRKNEITKFDGTNWVDILGGSVKSVNTKTPDASGNVSLALNDVLTAGNNPVDAGKNINLAGGIISNSDTYNRSEIRPQSVELSTSDYQHSAAIGSHYINKQYRGTNNETYETWIETPDGIRQLSDDGSGYINRSIITSNSLAFEVNYAEHFKIDINSRIVTGSPYIRNAFVDWLGLTTALRYKGSVADYASLPAANNQIGDVWNVLDTGDNFAWDGTTWDKLSGFVDISGKVDVAQGISNALKYLKTDTLGNVGLVSTLPATDIDYDSSTSGLTATTVQDAVDEVNDKIVVLFGRDETSSASQTRDITVPGITSYEQLANKVVQVITTNGINTDRANINLNINGLGSIPMMFPNPAAVGTIAYDPRVHGLYPIKSASSYSLAFYPGISGVTNGKFMSTILHKASTTFPGITLLNNTVTSTLTDAALTAAQGRQLNLQLQPPNDGKLYARQFDSTVANYNAKWVEIPSSPDVPVVQTLGQSTTDVMSQKAVTDSLFVNDTVVRIGQLPVGASVATSNAVSINSSHSANDSTIINNNIPTQYNIGTNHILIGTKFLSVVPCDNVVSVGNGGYAASDSVVIGNNGRATGRYLTVLGHGVGTTSRLIGNYSVALGYGTLSTATPTNRPSTVFVGDGSTNANYGQRIIANVKDPEEPQDAATKNYVDENSATQEMVENWTGRRIVPMYVRELFYKAQNDIRAFASDGAVFEEAIEWLRDNIFSFPIANPTNVLSGRDEWYFSSTNTTDPKFDVFNGGYFSIIASDTMKFTMISRDGVERVLFFRMNDWDDDEPGRIGTNTHLTCYPTHSTNAPKKFGVEPRVYESGKYLKHAEIKFASRVKVDINLLNNGRNVLVRVHGLNLGDDRYAFHWLTPYRSNDHGYQGNKPFNLRYGFRSFSRFSPGVKATLVKAPLTDQNDIWWMAELASSDIAANSGGDNGKVHFGDSVRNAWGFMSDGTPVTDFELRPAIVDLTTGDIVWQGTTPYRLKAMYLGDINLGFDPDNLNVRITTHRGNFRD